MHGRLLWQVSGISWIFCYKKKSEKEWLKIKTRGENVFVMNMSHKYLWNKNCLFWYVNGGAWWFVFCAIFKILTRIWTMTNWVIWIWDIFDEYSALFNLVMIDIINYFWYKMFYWLCYTFFLLKEKPVKIDDKLSIISWRIGSSKFLVSQTF